MAPLELTLYSKPGCHLCEEMKQTVQDVVQDYGGVLDEVDISGDPHLEARFGTEIPVLFVNGRKAFKYRLSERELRAHLRRAARG
jgi:glutaredoxin